MKYILLILALMVLAAGCISKEDQVKIDNLRDEVLTKLENKELSLADAQRILNELDDINKRNSTANMMEGIVRTLAGVAASLLGVRVWRGGVNNRHGSVPT